VAMANAEGLAAHAASVEWRAALDQAAEVAS